MRLKYPLFPIKITQYFSERPNIYKPLLGHNGIDFCTIYEDSPNGQRHILAAASGKVVNVDDQGTKGYGKYIRLKHEDGSETIYGHLSKQLVQIGQSVIAGEQIGISGNTGFSSAPHLHFGYRPPEYDSANGFGGYTDPLSLFENKKSEPVYAKPLTLLKKRDDPAIYVFGEDKLWHGLKSMEVLKTFKDNFSPDDLMIVDTLPSNIGFTLGREV